MKRSYLDPSASLEDALKDLVRECGRYRFDIDDLRGRIKHCLDQAAAVHGIDPAAVRSLLRWMQQTDGGKDDIKYARQQEIDVAYRAIVSGAVPIVASRVDTELDKVMPLVSNGKPPMIKDIMKAISCSRGKAHKLRQLAAVRLEAKSSCSSNLREHELSEQVGVAMAPQSPDHEGRVSPAQPESTTAPLDARNVVSLQRSG